MATNREQMAAISGGAGTGGSLVLPKFPYRPIPTRVAKTFPEIEQWNKEQHQAVEQWREEVNAILAGRPVT